MNISRNIRKRNLYWMLSVNFRLSFVTMVPASLASRNVPDAGARPSKGVCAAVPPLLKIMDRVVF
jgi:hypothetical protein